MNKKIGAIFAIIFAVIMIFGGVFEDKYDEYIDRKKINDDRITQQEQTNFESLLNTKTFYYYNTLDDVQKQTYIMVFSMFENFTVSRRLEVTPDELNEIFMAVLYDNSEFFWVDIKYNYIDYGASVDFMPTYRFEREKAFEMSEKLSGKINDIVKSADIFTTDYEKELYFHNYVCDATVYSEETFGEIGDTAYSALIDGKAICEGYSRAMQMLLDNVGIYNYLVVGDGVSDEGTEPHMWNIVRIDGENYHLDATWNDTGNEDKVGYLYFNVNDDFISNDHLNIEPANNNCTQMTANYFVKNGLYVDNFKNFAGLVTPVANDLKTGDNMVEILFSDENQLTKAMKSLENNNYEFFDFVGDAVAKSGKKLKKNEIEYYTLDGYDYLCLVFKEG